MSHPGNKRGSSGWKLLIALGILSAVVMGAVMVWINIERTNISYFINNLQTTIGERQALKAKLEVEREHLLSPYELGRKAESFGMHAPRRGQIRRMRDTQKNAGTTVDAGKQ